MDKNHWKKMRGKKYLGEWDLVGDEQKTLTITKVERELVKASVGAEAKESPVVYFKELKKGLVLNATNGDVITMILQTPYVEEWVGKKITIFRKEGVKSPKGKVAALRVSTKLPPQDIKKELVPEMEDDWNNAVRALKEGKGMELVKQYYTISPELEEALKEESKL